MNAKKLLIVCFFAVIVFMPLATFLFPKKTFSKMENRTLAKAPAFNTTEIANGSFMKDMESYMSDHMVFRNEFVAAKTRISLLTGKKDINGIFIGNNMLLENISPPDPKITQINCDAINSFADNYFGTIQTTVMLIPTAAEFYQNKLPSFAETEDQTVYIQNFYKALQRVNTVDVYTPLAASSNEYIFYRTDHHWTSYGAYIGYNALAKSLGYKAVIQDMFDIEHATHNFLGTLYSKAIFGENLKDGIDLYFYSQGNAVTDVIKYTGKKTMTYSSVFLRENLKEKDQYTVFLGSNVPVVKIKTNLNNGKKLLIFKDSFANTLMQFLPLHYEEIALVDLRYLNTSLSDYLNIKDYQQALFLYNVGNFTDNTSISKVLEY